MPFKSSSNVRAIETTDKTTITRVERSDESFNMIDILSNPEAREKVLEDIMQQTRGLAYYQLSIDELDTPLQDDQWLGVKVDAHDALHRPKNASTGFTTAKSLVAAFRDEHVRELLVPYIETMDADSCVYLPEHGFDILEEYDFDETEPAIHHVSRVCDGLNLSAFSQSRHKELIAIIQRVRENLSEYHEQKWQNGDMVIWDDRQWLHWRVPTNDIGTHEVFFDNNNTWHIDDFAESAIFSLAQIPGASHQLVKNHHRRQQV